MERIIELTVSNKDLDKWAMNDVLSHAVESLNFALLTAHKAGYSVSVLTNG